jgi:hypothetical protein
MDIEYGGHMKALPEFGASPDWRHSLDDQISSRMVELAGYSSWYPQFVFGQPLQVELALSLPQNWISICSGKKLADHVQEGRALTRWSSPKDTDILILASPNYKKRSFHESGVNLEIYYTQMPSASSGRKVRKSPACSSSTPPFWERPTSPAEPSSMCILPSGKAKEKQESPGQD